MTNVLQFPITKTPKQARVDALCEAIADGRPSNVVRHFATDGGVCLIVGECEVWFPAVVFQGLLSDMTETCEEAKRHDES